MRVIGRDDATPGERRRPLVDGSRNPRHPDNYESEVADALDALNETMRDIRDLLRKMDQVLGA